MICYENSVMKCGETSTSFEVFMSVPDMGIFLPRVSSELFICYVWS